MMNSKVNVLRPLIESKDGQHLTAYLANDGNIFELRHQLQQVIDDAYEYLAPVLHPDALIRFLAPLHNLFADEARLLQSFKGNIGIFRNENSFRLLSIPVYVEKTFVVAKSFHVKPLLRWMQFDRDFLVLKINEDSAVLLQGNQTSLNMLDTLIFPDLKTREEKRGRKKMKYSNHLVNEWLSHYLKNTDVRLFVSGPKKLTELFSKHCKFEAISILAETKDEELDDIASLVEQARFVSKSIAKREFDETLLEFYRADYLNLANRNIFQIAKSALNGKVKKLIIAGEVNIFGKIDTKSGNLVIHAEHLDHEDDDLLDDLAQEVLAHGGEVVVASQTDIPMKRPILAILEASESDISAHQPIPSVDNEINIRSVL